MPLPNQESGLALALVDTTDVEASDMRSQFDKLRDYIAGQIGAVRRVEAGQHSAELLLELAEDELGALRRELETTKLAAGARQA